MRVVWMIYAAALSSVSHNPSSASTTSTIISPAAAVPAGKSLENALKFCHNRKLICQMSNSILETTTKTLFVGECADSMI